MLIFSGAALPYLRFSKLSLLDRTIFLMSSDLVFGHRQFPVLTFAKPTQRVGPDPSLADSILIIHGLQS